MVLLLALPCGSLAPQVKPRYCRELHVREEGSAKEIVRFVDLYEDACVYDILRVLHVSTPGVDDA